MRDRILIVGGGMMGCGIAAAACAAGEKVTIVEKDPAARAAAPGRVKDLLRELADNDLAPAGCADGTEAPVLMQDSLPEACGTALLVIEAIVEDLAAKQSLFCELDGLLPPEVIIVSNTSGLRITDIACKARHRERTATAHFWFPAHLVPLVEVVMSGDTSQAAAEWVRERLKSWGKAPVIVRRDLPGQLANRILQAVIREASAIVEMGLASPEDVDTAVKMGMGIRFPVWGPLEHVDGVGLDLCARVQDTVLPGISAAQTANTAFTSRLESGQLGFKSGKGFYDWSQKDMKALEALRNAFIIQSVKFIKNHPV